MHDTTDRIRSVKRTLFTAQYFNLRHIVRDQSADVKFSEKRIGNLDAVDQEQGVIGFCAAQAQLGLSGSRAHCDPGHIP